MEIVREEIVSLQTVRTKLQSRQKELEDELKKTKEELEKKNNAGKEGEDEVLVVFYYTPILSLNKNSVFIAFSNKWL